MKRYHIIRRLLLLILMMMIGVAPAEARTHKASARSSAHGSAGHKASGRHAGSRKAGSRRAGGSRRATSRRSGGRHGTSHRSWGRRTIPAEALPDLPSTAPLDSADQIAGSPEPAMVDTMAQARDAMARNDPAEALGRYLRVLARNPTDLEALSGAGGAALAVGDADAAINFYSRAEKIAPRDGMVKAGLASALVQKEQPRAALKLFDNAVDLGVTPATVALDRGLAYDLRGDNRRAQQEYSTVLRARVDPEATRRMALSMAMAGDRQGALTVLDPLLRQRDIPAWRARAFVLAMTGDAAGAEQAAYAVLPRSQADELKPFLERLPQLKPAEKAAAVHFGHFPENKVPQLVDVSPAASGKSVPVVATASPSPAGTAYDGAWLAARPSTAAAAPAPVVTAPIRQAEDRPAAPAASPSNVVTAPLRPSDYRLPASSPAAGTSGVVTAPVRQAEVTLSAPAVDNNAAIAAAAAARGKADARKRAEDRQLADRKAAAEKAAADKADKLAADKAQKAADKKAKDREEAKAKSSDPERYWVQIASGAYRPDLDKELAKQKARFGKQLAGKTAWTTPYKATNRLLVGPFSSGSAAQEYVNEVRKDGLATFPVTTPAGQKVEKLK